MPRWVMAIWPSLKQRSSRAFVICRQRGYSLLECMVALSLLTVVVLAMAGLFLSGQASTGHSLEGSRGAQVAESELAGLKSRPFASLVGYITTPPAPRSVQQDGVEFRVETEVRRLDSSPASPDYDLLRLQVRVSWQENRRLEVSERQAGLKRVESQAVLYSVVGPESRF